MDNFGPRPSRRDMRRAQEIVDRARGLSEPDSVERALDEALRLDAGNADALLRRACVHVEVRERVTGIRGVLERLADLPSGAPGDPVRTRADAQEALGDQLVLLGSFEEAIEAYRAIPRLHGPERSGARARLHGLLLERGRTEEARELEQVGGPGADETAAWGAVLRLWMEGDETAAEAALAAARGQDPDAEAFLLRPEWLAAGLPRDDGWDGEDEDASPSLEGAYARSAAAACLWRAWHKVPGAREWLRDRATTPALRQDPSQPAWERILRAHESARPDGLVPFLSPPTPEVVGRLREILRSRDGHLADDFAPHRLAAWLLGQLGVADALPDIVASIVEDARERRHLYVSLAQAGLVGLGDLAVAPLVAAYDRSVTRDECIELSQSLDATGSRAPAVREVFLRELVADPGWGAGLLDGFGDPSVLPHLERAFADLGNAPDLRDPSVRETVLEFASAIETLGGQLTAAQRDLRAAAAALRREAFDAAFAGTGEDDDGYDHDHEEDDDLWSDAPPEPPYEAPPRPGRNDPCWCGSGTKYKRCHQEADDAMGGPVGR